MTLLKPSVCNDGTWTNPVPTVVGGTRNMLKAFGKLFTSHEERVPRHPLGPFHTDVSVYRTAPSSGLRITLLGHSSLLVEIDGTTLLIDPVFSERASMVQWAGPRRFFQPPISIQDLPPLDAVLLTHDHYDHLDAEALQHLGKRKPLFLCSTGVESHLKRWNVGNSGIHPMNWMSTFTVPSSSPTPLTLTALPARHFSGRSLRRNQTLWSSFVLLTEHHNLYHGADSGYYGGFREIGDHFGPFDLATLEIGAFDPLWDHIHLGPDNAMRAAADLRAKALMPIHWGLFNLAFHAWYQPPERITQLAAQSGLPLFLPRPGTPSEFTGAAANSLWWRQSHQPASHADNNSTGGKNTNAETNSTGAASTAASTLVHG